jgi:hypothetical protein
MVLLPWCTGVFWKRGRGFVEAVVIVVCPPLSAEEGTEGGSAIPARLSILSSQTQHTPPANPVTCVFSIPQVSLMAVGRLERDLRPESSRAFIIVLITHSREWEGPPLV